MFLLHFFGSMFINIRYSMVDHNLFHCIESLDSDIWHKLLKSQKNTKKIQLENIMSFGYS